MLGERLIEFRGKDIDSGDWHYGFYVRHEATTVNPIGSTQADFDNNVHHYIIWDGGSDWSLPKPQYRAEVDGKTVGQFTGQTDVAGRKVYEHDILQGWNSDDRREVDEAVIANDAVGGRARGFVEYAQTYCQFYFTTDGIEYLNLLTGLRDYEVIGNMHEDEEILREQV